MQTYVPKINVDNFPLSNYKDFPGLVSKLLLIVWVANGML